MYICAIKAAMVLLIKWAATLIRRLVMKLELVSTESNSEGKFKLEMLSCSGDMEHYATNRLGRKPEIGEEFGLATSWPARKDGLAATQDDYKKYGTSEAHGIFKRVA